jgi:hypothetical protein
MANVSAAERSGAISLPRKNIGQEKEVPEEEEEEVVAILSRGMQQPKMALLGAWGAQLQLARKKHLQ